MAKVSTTSLLCNSLNIYSVHRNLTLVTKCVLGAFESNAEYGQVKDQVKCSLEMMDFVEKERLVQCSEYLQGSAILVFPSIESMEAAMIVNTLDAADRSVNGKEWKLEKFDYADFVTKVSIITTNPNSIPDEILEKFAPGVPFYQWKLIVRRPVREGWRFDFDLGNNIRCAVDQAEKLRKTDYMLSKMKYTIKFTYM